MKGVEGGGGGGGGGGQFFTALVGGFEVLVLFAGMDEQGQQD